MESTASVAEVSQYHDHSYCLCYHCRPCSTCDAHIKHEDEYRVKYGVEYDSEYGQGHGFLRVAGRSHGGVEAEVQMRHDVSVKDDLYVFLCIRKGVFARTEEIEYRVYEYQSHGHEHKTEDHVKADYVSENLVCSLVVLLAQKDGKHGCSTGADKGTECSRKVH